MTKVDPSAPYTVTPGDTLWNISQKAGISYKDILLFNPGIDAEHIHPGQTVNLRAPATPACIFQGADISGDNTDCFIKTQAPKTQSQKLSKSTTLQEYEQKQSEAQKSIKDPIKAREHKEPQLYFAPEGKSTIGYGHRLLDKYKPKFLKDIDNSSCTKTDKAIKFNEAIKNKENLQAYKSAIKSELEAAAKNTGINNVSLKINDDLALTDEQISLLLNSDLKDKEKRVKDIVKPETYDKLTIGQKKALIDIQYNTGNLQSYKKLLNAIREGNMLKAQGEIDLFRDTNKTVKLDLIRRCKARMEMLTSDGSIGEPGKKAILKGVNAYLKANKKEEVKTYEDAQKILNE